MVADVFAEQASLVQVVPLKIISTVLVMDYKFITGSLYRIHGSNKRVNYTKTV